MVRLGLAYREGGHKWNSVGQEFAARFGSVTFPLNLSRSGDSCPCTGGAPSRSASVASCGHDCSGTPHTSGWNIVAPLARVASALSCLKLRVTC
jgi:hypothetical protein